MALSRMRRRAVLAGAMGTVLLAGAGLAAMLGMSLDNTVGGFVTGVGAGALFIALVLWFTPGDPDGCAPAALTRRYRRDLLPPMLLYVAVMLCWKWLLGSTTLGWLRVLVALLPALLVLLTIRAMARYVRDSDELQRRIELESVSIAAAIVGGAWMTGGFLQSAKLIDVPATLAMLCVFPALCLGYGLVKLVIARRYA